MTASAPSRGRRGPVGREHPGLVPSAQRLGRGLARTAFRPRVEGQENVPAEGPLVLAGNHAGWLDGPLVFSYTPRPASFLVKAEVYDVGPVGRVLDWLGQVPIHRGRPDRAALERCGEVLDHGGVVGVFPEGTRGSGELDQVQHGVARIALRAGCPVLPVATFGTSMALPKGRTLPVWNAPVVVSFGRPFRLEVEGDSRSRRVIAEAAEEVRLALRDHLADARTLVPQAEQP